MKGANYKHLGSYPNCLAEDIRHSWNGPPLVITNEEQRKGLEYALTTLKPRDKEILLCRYEKHLPYSAIGKQFGITGSRAQVVAQMCLQRLRHPGCKKYIELGYEEGKKWVEEWRQGLHRRKGNDNR